MAAIHSKDVYISYYDDYAILGLPSNFTYKPYSGNPDGMSNQTTLFETLYALEPKNIFTGVDEGLWITKDRLKSGT